MGSGSGSLVVDLKPRTLQALVFSFLAFGLLLRLLGAAGEPWLDEVWTFNVVSSFVSIQEVLTWYSDNNHLLNSAWVFFMSESGANSWRALALLSSAVLLAMPGFRALRGDSESLILLMLFSVSYPLTVYGSEARGYAPMLAALAGAYFICVDFTRERPTQGRHLLVFQIYCCLALLSHGSSLSAVAALCLWIGLVRGWRAFLLYSWLPAACALLLWLGFFRYLPPGSGDLGNEAFALIDALSVAVGGPTLVLGSPEGAVGLIGALLSLALILNAFLGLRSSNDNRWQLFALGVFIVPAVVLVAFQPRVLYARYFVGSILFVYFLLAAYFRTLYARGYQVPVYLMAAVITAASSYQTTRFIFTQRNSYAKALAAFEKSDIIASDHDFRHGTMIKYALGQDSPLLHASGDTNSLPTWAKLRESSDRRPNALILHSSRSVSFPLRSSRNDEEFCLQQVYPGGRLSGWSLAVYRPCEPESATTGSSREP